VIRVAIEGIDGAGKSTAMFGFHREEEFVPGLLQRLQSALPQKVFPTREPGSLTYSDGATPAWDTTPLMQIEDHLNTASFWTGMARFQVNAWSSGPEESPFYVAKSAIMVAEFMRRHRALPNSIKQCLLNPDTSTWPPAFSDELRQIQADHEEAYDVAHADPSLRRRFKTYDARDCLRHALVGASNSDEFPPAAKGLLFFASHIFNENRLAQKAAQIALYDRSQESQRAYGRARGDNGFVEDLYDAYGTEPDIVVLLTVSPGEGLRRKGGPDTDWEQRETLEAAQEAYLQRAEQSGAQWIRVATDNRSPEAVTQTAFERLLAATGKRTTIEPSGGAAGPTS
jgi:thymidylate kinase